MIIVPLKEHVATIFFENKHPTAERITQTMEDCKISCEINTVFFKEWMTATLSVKETDTLLQRIDDGN